MFLAFMAIRGLGAIAKAQQLSPEDAQKKAIAWQRYKKQFWKKNPKVLTFCVLVDVILAFVILVNYVAASASHHLVNVHP